MCHIRRFALSLVHANASRSARRALLSLRFFCLCLGVRCLPPKKKRSLLDAPTGFRPDESVVGIAQRTDWLMGRRRLQTDRYHVGAQYNSVTLPPKEKRMIKGVPWSRQGAPPQ